MRRLILAVGLVVVGSPQILAANAQSGQAQQAELAAEVSLDELKGIVKAKSAVIIDANGSKVYEEGHIPGAVSFAKNEGKLSQVLPKDKNALIIAYCGGPLCLAWEDAAKEAQKDGYTNLKHFKGGIKGWKEAKLPLETGSSKS